MFLYLKSENNAVFAGSNYIIYNKVISGVWMEITVHITKRLYQIPASVLRYCYCTVDIADSIGFFSCQHAFIL